MVPTMRGGGTGPPGVYGAHDPERSSRAGKVAQEKERVYHSNIAAQVYALGPLGFRSGASTCKLLNCFKQYHIFRSISGNYALNVYFAHSWNMPKCRKALYLLHFLIVRIETQFKD